MNLVLLDRYAKKSLDQNSFRAGDLLLAYPNGVTEVGKLSSRDDAFGTIILEDGSARTYPLRYFQKPLEFTMDDIAARVARTLAVDDEFFEEQFFDVISQQKFLPGGRTLHSAGCDGRTYLNCFVLPPPHDSRAGIIQTLYDMMEIMSRGGGVGLCVSSLRPRDALIYGVGGKSSGAISWSELYSCGIRLISQGGSRKGAALLLLNDWHPSLRECIAAKSDDNTLQYVNVSLALSDAFMQAVADDAPWKMYFPDTRHKDYNDLWEGDLHKWVASGLPVLEYERAPARTIWDEFIEANHQYGDPGVWFTDTVERYSNSFYYQGPLKPNVCGELALPSNGACCLGSLNLPLFTAEDGSVEWDELARVIRVGVRMLDNVLDRTPYMLGAIERRSKRDRRLGLGVLGLGEMLIKKKLRYGSPEALEFVGNLFKFIASNAYTASSDLAEERGPAPMYDKQQYMRSAYIRGLPTKVQLHIMEKGVRNITLLAAAPTGTLGALLQTSTGIEPWFSREYTQMTGMGTLKTELEWGDDPWYVTAHDITPREHIKMAATVQRWVDNAVSKTVNMPNSATHDDISDAYKLMHMAGIKGGTIYRDGSKPIQVLNHCPDGECSVAFGNKEACPTCAATPEIKSNPKPWRIG